MQDPTLNQMFISVIGAVLTVIVGVVGAAAKAYLVEKVTEVKTSKAQKQYEMGRNIMSDLVKSAKARGLNGELANVGKVLRAYVITRAQAEFDEHGLPFNAKQLDDLLEAAYIDTIWPTLQFAESELSQAPALPGPVAPFTTEDAS
jgi:hypothetical protein